MEFTVSNPNQALHEVLYSLHVDHVEEKTRNGEVWSFEEPVTIAYLNPRERVLFSPLRDANPAFHLIGDALWCLAGRNDIAWPASFNKRYAEYSDDGTIQPGAYGYRWRGYFGYDQLQSIVQELTKNPNSRRAVLTMWDGGCPAAEHYGDLQRTKSVDLPCNTHAYFDLRGDRLNMTVLQRSGDILWGTLGANAVVFSVLQEYLAAALKKPVGLYRQFCNNLHLYTSVLPPEQLQEYAQDADEHDYYLNRPLVKPFPLVNTDIQTWDNDLRMFFESRDGNPVAPRFKDVFFSSVVWPMWRAWRTRKDGKGTGLEDARLIAAEDWRRACVQWIERREAKKCASV